MKVEATDDRLSCDLRVLRWDLRGPGEKLFEKLWKKEGLMWPSISKHMYTCTQLGVKTSRNTFPRTICAIYYLI